MTVPDSGQILLPPLLSDPECALLRAMADALFPELDGDGLSATKAGAVDYVLGLLARDPELTGIYRAGLAFAGQVLGPDAAGKLSGAGEDAAGHGLERLFDLARVTDVPLGLSGMPAASALGELGTAGFILILWQHVRQGLFGDPRHGGNRDACVWSWLGYSGPQLRGYTDSEVLENRLISRPIRTAADWRDDDARR